MIKRIISLLTIAMLILTLVPVQAFAVSSEVTINTITNKYPGEDIVIKGTTNLSELSIRVIRPDNVIMYIDILTKTQYETGKTITLPIDAQSGTYTVIAGTGSDVASTTFTVNTAVATPTPTPTATPSSAPTTTPKMEAVGGKIEIKTIELSENGKLGVVQIDEKAINDAIAQVKANNTGIVKIEIPEIEGVTKVSVSIPAQSLAIAKSSGTARIQIDTGLAIISITPEAFGSNIDSQSNSIQLTVDIVDNSSLPASIAEQVGQRKVINLNAYVDGKKVTSFSGNSPVQISFDYQLGPDESPDQVVVYYIKSTFAHK